VSIIDVPIEDHESYRNELASISIDGRRKWIYARQPNGKYTRSRAIVATILLAFLAISPFVKVHGHQFMLLNIMERQFVFFGLPFWPNDFYLVALVFITVVITLVVSTAIVGRIWCGWLCPQTIFLEFIFRRIEWWIDGTPVQQAQRRSGPWNTDRIWRTTLKQSIFFAISFAIANIFLAYLISSDRLLLYITEGPGHHAAILFPLTAFTFVFYAVFARFREQACLIVCPYGRYMSSLVDDNTITVTYDTTRGEHRGKFTKADKEAWHAGQARPEGKGDCVDCHQCVTVCPTGIDIRNGIQLECVACTACIDACDEVMEKVGRPKGLIRYTSATAVKNSVAKVCTTRIKAYVAVWVLLLIAVIVLFSLREMLDVLVLRQEGTTWVKTPQGVANFYRMQIINKSDDELPVELVAVEPANAIITPIESFEVIHGGHIAKGRFIVTIPGADGMQGAMPITISIRSNGREVKSVTTSFIGGSL